MYGEGGSAAVTLTTPRYQLFTQSCIHLIFLSELINIAQSVNLQECLVHETTIHSRWHLSNITNSLTMSMQEFTELMTPK